MCEGSNTKVDTALDKVTSFSFCSYYWCVKITTSHLIYYMSTRCPCTFGTQHVLVWQVHPAATLHIHVHVHLIVHCRPRKVRWHSQFDILYKMVTVFLIYFFNFQVCLSQHNCGNIAEETFSLWIYIIYLCVFLWSLFCSPKSFINTKRIDIMCNSFWSLTLFVSFTCILIVYYSYIFCKAQTKTFTTVSKIQSRCLRR